MTKTNQLDNVFKQKDQAMNIARSLGAVSRIFVLSFLTFLSGIAIAFFQEWSYSIILIGTSIMMALSAIIKKRKIANKIR